MEEEEQQMHARRQRRSMLIGAGGRSGRRVEDGAREGRWEGDISFCLLAE